MKKYLLILVLITSPLIGQDISSKKTTSPHVSLFTVIYGMSNLKGFTTPLIGVGLEYMIGKKIYYYGKLQFNYRFYDSIIEPEKYVSPMALQIQTIGIGFYLFDFRSSNNIKAWSMVINISFGLGINFGHDGFVEWADNNSLDRFETIAKGLGMMIYVPIEMTIYTRYHFNTTNALQFGFNIAGQLGAYNKLLYGFTLGFTF